MYRSALWCGCMPRSVPLCSVALVEWVLCFERVEISFFKFTIPPSIKGTEAVPHPTEASSPAHRYTTKTSHIKGFVTDENNGRRFEPRSASVVKSLKTRPLNIVSRPITNMYAHRTSLHGGVSKSPYHPLATRKRLLYCLSCLMLLVLAHGVCSHAIV